MKSIFALLQRPRGFTKPRREVDPAVVLSRRQWADLPPHHPRTERD